MKEYSYHSVNEILQNYLNILDGSYSLPKTDPTSSHSIFSAPFISQCERKADVDVAIDSFGKPGAWHKFSKVIDDIESSQSDLNFKQQTIVKYIYDPARVDPSNAISEIVNFLNGETEAALVGDSSLRAMGSSVLVS